MTKKTRRWMRIGTGPRTLTRVYPFRQVSISDAPALAELMDRSYRGTIDHEGETLEQCLDEMKGTLSGRYGPFLDFASFAITRSGRVLSASLITLWKEKPLVAYSMSDPEFQGLGYAGFLLERSIDALAQKGYTELYLVVTDGNTPAEKLYRKLGFESLGTALPQTPPPTD